MSIWDSSLSCPGLKETSMLPLILRSISQIELAFAHLVQSEVMRQWDRQWEVAIVSSDIKQATLLVLDKLLFFVFIFRPYLENTQGFLMTQCSGITTYEACTVILVGVGDWTWASSIQGNALYAVLLTPYPI